MDKRNKGFSAEMIKATPWLIVAKLFVYCIGFVSSIVIVRSLTPHDYGVFAFCRNMAMTLMVFCSLGLNASALRFIPELLAKNNISGIKRYINKTFLLQGFVISIVAIMAIVDSRFHFLGRVFNIDFNGLIFVVVFLMAVMVAKDLFYSLFTANYKTKILAFTSVVNGILWLLMNFVVLVAGWGVRGFLLAQIASLLVITVILAAKTRTLYWRKARESKNEQDGVGKKRVAVLSATYLFSSGLNLILMTRSGIFFIGHFYGADMVGYYSLGNYIAHMAITFVPFAVVALFKAGFAEAYTKDRSSIPHLVKSSYKLLIFGVLPISVFGMCFADKLIVIIYGSKMAGAGVIARIFFGVQLLSFVSIPLAMALTAKEKIQKMIPYQVAQVLLSVIFNYFLIKHFGWGGAILAIVLTYLITIPFRMARVKSLIGGIYFPYKFFFKACAACLPPLILLFFKGRMTSMWMIPVFCAAYIVLWGIGVKAVSLLKREDMEHFIGGIHNPRILRVIGFVVEK